MNGITYRGRQAEVLSYFNTLLDYIWKLPRMLESEVELERRKLDEYWPYTGDPRIDASHATLRKLRTVHESGKLFGDFPVLMASSALIQSVSAFEYHLLLICRDYEAIGFEPLDGFRFRGRRGAGRLLAYIEKVAQVDPATPHLGEIRCAMTFRNCLAYANGVLALFKEAEALRSIIKNELHWPPKLRGVAPSIHYDTHPRLIVDDLGERLYVPTYYSHWLAAKARDTLVSLCVEATRADAATT